MTTDILCVHVKKVFRYEGLCFLWLTAEISLHLTSILARFADQFLHITPCNNFISSTENMLVLHKDSFKGFKFHYIRFSEFLFTHCGWHLDKYSRLRGTQMFLITLLQKKIIDFIQFE